MIMDELGRLQAGQEELLRRFGVVETKLAVVNTQLIAGEKRFAACDGHFARTAELERQVSVIAEQVTPLRNVVYGGVAAALLALAGALIASVLK